MQKKNFSTHENPQQLVLYLFLQNSKIFNYTCGGMGLTGIIISCKFKLIPIETSYIFQETQKARNLDEIFDQ